MNGKAGDSRHKRSSVKPGMACGFRQKMTGTEDFPSSSHLTFQKEKAVGGTAASAPTTHPAKKVERFI
jgi:hypothetical protein